MAFIESPRFPDGLAFGAQGGPGFLTMIVELESGHEQRNQVWSLERGEWTIAMENRVLSERQALQAHFRAVGKGRLNGFRFKDFLDFEASHTEGVLELVSAGVYQLQKRYTSGANTYDRDIKKPVSGTVEVKNGSGAVLVAGGDYTIDTTTGRITMQGSPTLTPATWSGQFDVPVRYNTDRMQVRAMDRDNSGLLTDWVSVELVEIRV
jgi:uncharacterized protein (TIGR02217 family)